MWMVISSVSDSGRLLNRKPSRSRGPFAMQPPVIHYNRNNNSHFNIWVFPKIGEKHPPNHPFVHRVFHYFHHPFWGTNIFGNTHISTPFFLSFSREVGLKLKHLNTLEHIPKTCRPFFFWWLRLPFNRYRFQGVGKPLLAQHPETSVALYWPKKKIAQWIIGGCEKSVVVSFNSSTKQNTELDPMTDF